MPSRRPPRGQRGFSIVAGIFILVVLAALAGFIVSVTAVQQTSFVQDLTGARAYQAARAGAEWAIHRWLPESGTGVCANGSLSFPGTDLAGFTVTVTAAERTHAASGVRFCDITSLASTSGSAPGSLGYAERELRALVEKGE